MVGLTTLMATTTPAGPPPPALPAKRAPGTRPVHVWATIGAALIAAELVVLGRWVSGPNFERIPVGVDQPPAWMQTTLDVLQVVVAVVAAVVAWTLLVRPLIRERTVTLNGLFVIAGLLAAPWDGLSGAAQHWLHYNSYLVNRGSVISELPGALSPNTPGVGQAWPFMGFGAYIILIPLTGALGAGLMKRVRRRVPSVRSTTLVAICVVAMGAFDAAIELVLLPLGVYQLNGGPWQLINGDRYYGYPLVELLHASLFFSVPAVIKFFVDDKGETFAERGAHAVRGATARTTGLRGLAVIGAVHLGLLCTFHVPVMFYAVNSREYSDDVKTRSYFLGNTCGEEIDRACPGPDTPVLRPGSGHFDWEGDYVPPEPDADDGSG